MNNKEPQTSVFKDTFKAIIDFSNIFLRRIKEKIIDNKHGIYVFIVYLILIVVFAFWYNSIYQSDSNNFLISNPELNQKMKNQNVIDKKESLKLIEDELKIKRTEIDSVKLVQNALNLFDENSTYLQIHNNKPPDSILFYGRRSFRLRSINTEKIGYLVMPIFENRTYQYEIYANYQKLSYYFSDENHPISIRIIVRNREIKKMIYYEEFSYYSPSKKGYIDIKTFYIRSVSILNNWVKNRLYERENEYRDLEDSKEVIINHLKDSNHYLSFLDFLYFSTITQSSTGYGDILPNSKLVRMVVTLQIILGLFILGVVITFISKKKY